MLALRILVVLSVLGYTLAFAGEYIPKSYYVIDPDGHKSDVVYFRSKRDVEMFPLLRFRRGGGSSSSARSSASASSNAGSSGGGYNSGLNGGGYNSGLNGGGYNSGGGYAGNGAGNGGAHNSGADGYGGNGGDAIIFGGGAGGQAQSFASASSSSSSFSDTNGDGHGASGYSGPILFSRFGEDTGSGVHVTGSAQGQRGAFSQSSSSVDSDGKVKYSVQSGKY